MARFMIRRWLANVDFMRLVLFLIPNTAQGAMLLQRIPGFAY